MRHTRFLFFLKTPHRVRRLTPMNLLSLTDGTQPITLWHHQNDTTTVISLALIRRYRHRRYSQVVDSAVPVNFAHWYFASSVTPLPGDEIHESDNAVWTILEVNLSPLTGVWQAVCETFVFAEPTENVAHLRQLLLLRHRCRCASERKRRHLNRNIPSD